MGENGIPMEYQNGGSDSRYENGEMLNGAMNGDSKHSSKHKHKDKSHDKERRKETEEERRVRKQKEHEEREKRYKKEGKRMETEEERKVRKEKERREREERHKKEGRREETEDERAIRKEKERKEKEDRQRNGARREETEDERAARKEKERREREERHKKEGRREETEDERAIRKEKERKEKEDRQRNGARREETEDERAARKEKERREREERHKKEGRREETEEERRIRKEKERKDKDEKHRSKEKDHHGRNNKETEEERRIRKDRERRERKEREADDHRTKIKQEDIEIKTEPDDSQDNDTAASANEEDNYMEHNVKEEQQDSDDETMLKNNMFKEALRSSKRKAYETGEEDEFYQSNESKKQKVKSEPIDYELQKIKKEDIKKEATEIKVENIKDEVQSAETKGKKKVKKEEPVVWKWWEEEKEDETVKFKFMQHNGPLFPPEYEPLPSHVRFYYDKKMMKLSLPTEELATFYGKMIDHDYTTKPVFNKNFMKDWRRVMTEGERATIRELSKCDFTEIDAHFKSISEQRKNRPREEKLAEKAKNAEIAKEYGVCIMDGFEQKIANYRVEPPGLFRGRGEHPKQGMHKHRLKPEDITINCSADSMWPEPPKGHQWKKVQHDNKVTWLAMWIENVQNQIKYVMLNPSSKLKGENDMKKYEKARKLKLHVDMIRKKYTEALRDKEMRVRQRAVALYFIDKFALRAGNEKDEDAADTVGCCSLRVEHIKLSKEKDGKQNVVEFDFLGKDSIQYKNEVSIDKRVFKNLQLFMENKKKGDDLFDRLTTAALNEYLNSLMEGLSAKVFRTYNASITLQEQLEKLTEEDDNIPNKMLSYNRANRAVAILCNHQRAAPKTHEKSMEGLQNKIDLKIEAINTAEQEYKDIKKKKKGDKESKFVEQKKRAVERLKEQLHKLETERTTRDENKTVSLGTSKLNYLDPRISVGWCKKFDVPIEKVFSKTQREKFRWAIDMAGPDFVF